MVQQQRITGSPIKAYHGPQAVLKGCHGLHWEGWQVLHNRGNDRFCLFVRHIMTFFLYVSVLIIRSRWFQEITYLSSMHKEKKNQARLSSAGNCEADGHLRFFQEALIYQHDHYPYNPNTHTVIDLLIQWVYCLNKLYCSYPFKRFWAIGKPSNNHAVTVVKTGSGQHSHTCTHTDRARLWFNQLP